MASHDNREAEDIVPLIHRRERATLLAPEDRFDDRAAEAVQIPGHRPPIEGGNAILDGRCCRGHTVILSRARRARLRSTPQRYPEMSPLLRTTRWQGMATASAFAPQACATALTAVGAPMALASCAYVVVFPAGTRLS